MHVDVDAQCTPSRLKEQIADYDVLIVRSRIDVDRSIIDRGIRLRCIGRVGAGMETIDVAYAQSRGIACLNSPEGNRDAVGEHTLGLLLALFNRMARADAEVRRGSWRREPNRGREIKGCTVGIIGFGNMGGAFASRLAGMQCRVLAYDIAGTAASGFALGMPFVTNAPLQMLLEEANVVSLHVPLTESTRHMVDRQLIEAFRRPVTLINTSRGAVVDTIALANALRNGSVEAAALDVTETEDMHSDGLHTIQSCDPFVADRPITTLTEAWHYICHSNRTLLTPHVAGWTWESKERLWSVLADKIIHHLRKD